MKYEADHQGLLHRHPFRLWIVILAIVGSVSCTERESVPTGDQGLNVLVITLDTIRTDRLGAYGNSHIRTDFVDGLADRGVVFDRCIAPTPLTLPSHTSLFTGTYPVFHGVRDNGNYVVPAELTTMAELLSGTGYRTGAFVGATYTLSRAHGNVDGETSNSGPVTSGVLSYPEYNSVGQYDDGDLATDQRHNLRAWLSWDFVSTSRWNLNASWLENFYSGSPYGASRSVKTYNGSTSNPWIDNPGYLNWPFSTTYRFFPRDAYLTDNVHRTDLALNFSFFIGKSVEIFLQPEVLNVFNESAVIDPNNVINARRYGCSSSVCQYFNPFDESYTPVEGLDYEFGSNFGEPDNENDFQDSRTVRFSVGVRF